MAIYHLRASMISRSAGRSATAAAAYRSGTDITDRRTGLSFDYSKRGGVDHVEILAPDHAPAWVADRAELWNRVEAAETRKNSQVAREIRVALPHELSATQRIALVRGFCQREFVDRGMVADIALHAPGRAGDERNHHAHILLTTREIGPEGFEAKNRGWNAVELLEAWREAWAQDSNRALERCGAETRIDHRTLAAQREEAEERAQVATARGDEAEALRQTVRAASLDRAPLSQLSAGAWQLKERGIEVAAVRAWREVKAQAAEVARVAERLSGQVRAWLGRGLERLAGPELAIAGTGSAPKPDIRSRLREMLKTAPGAEPKLGESLADQLRAAARGMDAQGVSERLAALRQGREADQAQKDQESVREKGQERKTRDRDDGWDYGL